MSTALNKNIKDIIYNITEIVKMKIPSLINFIFYKDLSDVFDSTFSLKELKIIPYEIIEESNILINKLDKIYNGIEKGSLKNNITILNDYIYKFIKQSHILVNEISNNLKDLGDLIKKPKQAISDISNYYMNHTSTSYIDTIIDSKNILMNYFIKEKDLIVNEIENILEKFENNTFESISKQIKLVNILNEKIYNNSLVIKDANDEKVDETINNLYNSNNYIKNIINLFKEKIRKEMGLKDGYFISQYDIESYNKSFSKIIEDALNTAQKLEDNEYVDKKFDEIMTIFRNEFTSITKYMNVLKEQKFPVLENVLNGRYFKKQDIDTLSRDLKDLSGTIINNIKNENNIYLNRIKNKVDEFLQNNLENLNNIIYELNKKLSEVELGKIDNLYEKAFNEYLSNINDKIKCNKDLAYDYLDGLIGVMSDNTKLLKLFTDSNPVNKALPPDLNCYYPTHDHCWKYTRFVDSVATKYKTQYYFTKYNTFRVNFESSKEFILHELRTNLIQDYKSMINNIKGSLHSFKNNKMSDKYPELEELYFIDNHLKQFDTFYNNLNKYISDDRFNQYYLPKIKKCENEANDYIDNMIKNIEEKHKKISPGNTENDYKNDFCTTYKRKKTYTCNNGDLYYYDESGKLCFLSPSPDNYKQIKSLYFESDTEFKKEFENYSSFIRNKIDSYNKIISDFKKSLIDIESQVLEEDIIHDYLSSIQEKINSIISEKYSDNLIRASYDYYKEIIDSRLKNVLNETSNKWINSFNTLEQNINNNLNTFKNSINEFSILAQIYNSIINQNITSAYYDSIINHQKSEFNYTISYYYNCLLQNITSVYQYIINQIPTNEEGFNNILDLRKEEVENKFNDFFNLVKQSKEESLSLEQQLNVLQVAQSNFFKVNSIMQTVKDDLSSTLKNIYNTIKKIKNGKQNNENSLACRFYLENSLNGWQIDSYYEEINENIFIELYLDQFENILSNNWIFDQDDFINKLNTSIYNTNLEIINDYKSQKEEYENDLEKEITGVYSKDKILNLIDEQYQSQIKTINEEMANNIILNIKEILELIKTHLINEEKRLRGESASYSTNIKIINKTIQTLKESIIDKLEEKIKIIVNGFYNNMFSQAYARLELYLDSYLESANNFSNKTESFNTLKSSFNIGRDIYEIVDNLVSDYKNFTDMQIKLKNDEYIEKKYKEAKIDEIKKLINDELDPIFLGLLNTLKNISVDNVGNKDYDLSNIIKDEINSKINEKIETINNTIQEIKGDKYYVDLKSWQKLDFTRNDIFENIKKQFESFINGRINEENNLINNFLKEIIRKNFNTLINNLLLSFGTEFFERILKYNENFKITTLYQNLKYSSVVSLQYYQFLYALKKSINSLTQDLKIKLYNLNKLDKIAQEKNQKVLNLLDNKIDDFITKAKQQIINDYSSYLKNDALIKNTFNKRIIDSIEFNLKDISHTLEKDFLSLLNELKRQFKEKFTKVMNAQTDEMILTINQLKENIKSIIDDLFSLDIEEVLQETNQKMNETIDSIENYTTYFNSFKLPEEFISFSDNYGDNVIQRAYDGLETLVNKETQNITMTNFNRSYHNYENYLNLETFLEIKDNILSSIKNDNIYIIKNHINSYGLENYPNILNEEINRINARRLRRLEDKETETDINEEFNETVVDKSIDENFNTLLNISENSIKYIKTEESFDKFEEIINKSVKKLNISYRETQQIIANAYEDDDLFETLNNKSDDLYNYSINYYETLRDDFISLKTYIEDSLLEINTLLNKCANITYKTFEDKCEQISSEIESIDKEYDEDIDKKRIKEISSNQNGEFETTAEFQTLNKKGRFKFSLIKEGDGKIKKHRIEASVVNQIKPELLTIKVSKQIGSCGKDYYEIKAPFNNVNYSSYIDFDFYSKQTDINYTTITNFEKYRYSIGRYKIENSDETICIDTGGTITCIEEECDENSPINTEIPEFFNHDEVNNTDTIPFKLK